MIICFIFHAAKAPFFLYCWICLRVKATLVTWPGVSRHLCRMLACLAPEPVERRSVASGDPLHCNLLIYILTLKGFTAHADARNDNQSDVMSKWFTYVIVDIPRTWTKAWWWARLSERSACSCAPCLLAVMTVHGRGFVTTTKGEYGWGVGQRCEYRCGGAGEDVNSVMSLSFGSRGP